MQIADKPFIIEHTNDRDFNGLKDKMKEIKGMKTKIVFVIIPDRGGMYAKIKQTAEIDFGVLTQCIKSGTVSKKRTDGSTISNILLKVNAKLNGTNHRLQTQIRDSALNNIDKCMIIGADVTHPSPDQRLIPR